MFATKRVMLPCIAPDAHLDLSRSLILAEATNVAQIPMIPGPQYLLFLLLPQKKSKKTDVFWRFSVPFDGFFPFSTSTSHQISEFVSPWLLPAIGTLEAPSYGN
jgi:hypothetical protein